MKNELRKAVQKVHFSLNHSGQSISIHHNYSGTKKTWLISPDSARITID